MTPSPRSLPLAEPAPPGQAGLARTQDEILARIREAEAGDPFGFRRDPLIDALDFEHAAGFLREGVTAEQWAEQSTADRLDATAREYFSFALDKIENHRGLSAQRSTLKLTEYAWLLGRDDVVEAMEEAGYLQYGAPVVKAFGDGFGLPWPDAPDMVRMAEGLPCCDDCDEGCSL